MAEMGQSKSAHWVKSRRRQQADVNAQSAQENHGVSDGPNMGLRPSPLHFAASSGDVEVAALLMEKGANSLIATRLLAVYGVLKRQGEVTHLIAGSERLDAAAW